MGFPDGAVVKNHLSMEEVQGDKGLIPGSEDPAGVVATYFRILARNLVDLSLVVSPWDRKEMDITEQLGTDIEGYPLDERVNILVSLLLCHVGNTPVE